MNEIQATWLQIMYQLFQDGHWCSSNFAPTRALNGWKKKEASPHGWSCMHLDLVRKPRALGCPFRLSRIHAFIFIVSACVFICIIFQLATFAMRYTYFSAELFYFFDSYFRQNYTVVNLNCISFPRYVSPSLPIIKMFQLPECSQIR